MPTAWIRLDNRRNVVFGRALLDSGCQHTLITRDWATKLRLRIHPEAIQLRTLSNADQFRIQGYAYVTLCHQGDPPNLIIKAYVLDGHLDPLPVQAFNGRWSEFRKFNLADPLFYLPRIIGMLIGSDVLPHLILPGTLRPSSELPGALSTTLGWVLYGPYARYRKRTKHVSFSPDIVNGFTRHPPSTHQASQQHTSSSSSAGSSPAVPSSSLPQPGSPLSVITCHSSSDKPKSSDASPQLLPSDVIKSHAVTDLQTMNMSPSHHLDQELVHLVRRFWELDKVPEVLPLTPAEKECEMLYRADVTRDSNGRYTVGLPLSSSRLGTSVNVATRQFIRLEHRLDNNPALRVAYHEFMHDYLESGHMELVPESSDCPRYEPYYIPHHPVHRHDDPPTKIRVVFNASCASANGKSLNDLLLTGPKLQADIFTLLLRFRLHRYVFTADIRQMYRQILISPEQRDYQRIVWRFTKQEPLQYYRLNTVTYGVSSAPYLALRTLRQLASDDGPKFPAARQVLLDEIYVDDILTGCSSEAEALELRRQVQNLLMAGGFELRKWASNHLPLLDGIPSDHRRESSSIDPLLFDREPSLKILGLGWNPASDHFFYSVRLTSTAITKRSVLSQMARIFDPLGWLAPVTFYAKIFFRQLCLLHLEWDQPLSSEVQPPWLQFQSQLPTLTELHIPRFISAISSTAHRLIGFCDASESGYAAVVYLRTFASSGHYHVSLLAAKSKIAPCKATTLPRLELCGAHLLAKLMHHLSARVLQHLTTECIAFCDSSVALSWIRGESHRWKTFVGNRVAEIQDLIPSNHWRHGVSEDNPADCASRGLMPADIHHHPLWWRGPHWLSLDSSLWPLSSVDSSQIDQVDEKAKPLSALVLTVVSGEPTMIDRFSSYLRLKRVIAFCRRFILNARGSALPRTGFLTSVELQEAEICLIRLVQSVHFAEELVELQRPSSRHRLIMKLHLFCDEHGLVRVGGRLSASLLPYRHKHPVLLPKDNHLTHLIIDDAHYRLLHAGALATHSYIRRRYWILDGRNVVRNRLRKCNRCFSCKPRPLIQPMGNLPPERLSSAMAFLTTGVDYAGPFYVTSARLRGAVSTKAYLVVFICFSTKAVHLELASELSTPAFIAAYRRFVARRGHPSVIFSDNGTNFVGAHNYLRDLGRLLSAPQHQQSLCDAASSSGTDWRFIPPSSPHFGGLWEAAVKSAKHHLTRVIGEQKLTYEEFLTICTQVEAILNSRPLYLPSSDPSDFEALTPGHFLVFRSLTAPPDNDVSSVSVNRLSRWQLVQRFQQDFWKRWRQEYLHTLQQRHKWLQPSTPILPGTVVVIRDDNLPPLKWSIGRISSVFPGTDSTTRVADVTTSSEIIRDNPLR
ncbi:uncharacterized protein LOC123680913 [Harmonia axyridis]|uniref:uncharacterized protein LOC123680913 n=1 Tax=Harmonia axyridis TaxID=115357 RepID=UPI001E277EB3|nr:uncharacterized protein LOC123680913 [Harmonia axyridis]